MVVIKGGIQFELTLQPGMDFHNSAIYNGKAIQSDTDDVVENISEDIFSLCSSSGKKFTSGLGDVVDSSWPNECKKVEGAIAAANSFCFGQPVIALNLHNPTKVSENNINSATTATNLVSSNTTKRSRSSYQNAQTSRCQVEGCNIDLSTAKDYHRRHRICECHSKSPKVIVAGMERRFCQQCSRFHNLAEFDDKKRSCRRRLSDHNARRRRPPPESMHLSSMGLTSSFYDRRPPSFLLNRLASSVSNITTWETSCSLKMTHANNSLIRASGNDGIESAANPCMNEAPNMRPRALSLLSVSATTSWGLNQPESTSLDPFMQGSGSISPPITPLESQNWPLFSPQPASAEQPHSISPLQ